jgi:hypothetical protein
MKGAFSPPGFSETRRTVLRFLLSSADFCNYPKALDVVVVGKRKALGAFEAQRLSHGHQAAVADLHQRRNLRLMRWHWLTDVPFISNGNWKPTALI